MTPNINLDVIKRQPLWNPHYAYLVAEEALRHVELHLSDLTCIKRISISDFLIVAFAVLINEKYITIAQVDHSKLSTSKAPNSGKPERRWIGTADLLHKL